MMSFKEKTLDFFRSYKGLISFLSLYIFVVVLFLSTFSGPMVDRFGDMPVLKYIFPLIKGLPEERHEQRAIMIYHALALPFMVIVVFMFLNTYQSRPTLAEFSKWSLFVGSLLASLSALIFAYFLPTNWAFHGLFIVGQSIVFFGGILFLLAIWPTKTFPDQSKENPDAMILGVNFEYLNLAITTIAILISSIIAAYAASFFGRVDPNYPPGPDPQLAIEKNYEGNPDITRFVPRLMEKIVRREYNNAGYTFYEMIVTHLHIMVALLSAAVLLYTFRFANMKGIWFKAAQAIYTPGVIILSIGAWLVITPWEYAHKVINVGAGLLLISGLIVAIYGWIEIAKEQLGDEYANATVGQKVLAMFKDPVKFTLYFQLIWVNVVTTVPGIYVGINLERFRSEAYYFVEYSFNVGHWHILATLTAVMAALILMDYYGLKGNPRLITGWAMFFGTVLGFGFATKYMLRDPATTDAQIELDFFVIDIGLGLLFLGLGILMIYILIDHYKNKLKS